MSTKQRPRLNCGRRAAKFGSVLLCVFLSTPTIANAHARPDRPQEQSAQIRQGQLDNGLKYEISHRTVGKISFRLTVHAGSGNVEPGDTLQIAHLVEHVVAGRAGYGMADRLALVQKVGLQWSRDVQAYTGMLVTEYHVDIPENRPDLISVAVDILRSYASGAIMDPAVIDLERQAVINEVTQGQFPEVLNDFALMERIIVTPCNPVGSFASAKSALTHAPWQSVKEFYDKWYHPANYSISIAGAIDVLDMEKRVIDSFQNLQAKSGGKVGYDTKNVCRMKFSEQPEVVVNEQAGMDKAILEFWIVRPDDQDSSIYGTARSKFVDEVANAIASQRARQLTERYNKPYDRVTIAFDRSTISAFGVRATTLQIHLGPASNLSTALKDALQLFAGFRASEVSLDEIRAAANAVRQTPGRERQTPEAVPDPTANEIKMALTSAFGLDRKMTVALTYPSGTAAQFPDEAGLLQLVRNASIGEVVPFRLRVAPKTLIQPDDQPPAPPASAIQSSDVGRGVTQLIFDNGVKVLVKPDAEGEQSDKIRISGLRHGGLNVYGDADKASAAAISPVVRHSGAGVFDKFAIDDFDRMTEISLTIGLTDASAIIEGSAPPSRLEELLQRIYLTVAAPRWDTIAFSDWQRQHTAGAGQEGEGLRVKQIFDRHYGLAVSQDSQSESSEVTLAKVQNIFADRFGKMGDFQFVISGPVRGGEAFALINRYISALPSGRSTKPETELVPNFAPREAHTLRSPAQFGGAGSLALPIMIPRETRQRVAIELLVKALNQRVHRRLRVREGLSYGAWGLLSTRGDPERKSGFLIISVEFDAPAERVDEAMRFAIEEIELLQRDGINDTELNDAKKALVNDVAFTATQSWHDFLLNNAGRDLEKFNPDYRRGVVDNMSSREVSEAARHYLKMDHALAITRLPPNPPGG